MTRWNCLSWRNDRAALFRSGRPGLAIQVEVAVFIGGLGISSFFAFLSTSSFVYIGHYGLTPTQYSMAFSINAIGFIGASQFAGFLGGRFGMGRMVMAAVSAYASFAV
ncbi:MAG: Bcr/CflA family drug resistance efflux transporter, partial [Bradyrhizobium sp.]|nr:Bcr/CflA family drug resistance efflux transporter [Bradyrhizobium sp.]